ncbi:TetR/AcrR family transcriptional regulator [Sanguibacter antarcticus]|uniref:TetR family transcriptional regulator n=1 Tax=Sanguibacter antarcticus TaxID=372484 RepID=A0A2A9E5V2_9MICO|nr:TetR/AcrR family transcriptional regulator [Sanguibacter antarcticus]PFG34437.1 TetR family transcriptional regulator [Sanguibacter antarcticus]
MGRTGPHRDPELTAKILASTHELICTKGPRAVTINEIAAHAGVGKQTIYRWWPTKASVVIDALEQQFASDNPFPTTGSAKDDLRAQMRAVARTFSSPTGSMIRELVAQSQGDPALADDLRTRFVAERRSGGATALRAGIDHGQIRADLDIEIALDLLYAPLWMRMLLGHQPLDEPSVDAIVDQVWPALAA